MNRELPLIGCLDNEICFVQENVIGQCKTYRQAVRLSWDLRRHKGMTMRTLAEITGSYPSHISDYLAKDDKPTRRDLKAEDLHTWALAVGNYAVQQWLAKQDQLTILEELQAQRRAA